MKFGLAGLVLLLGVLAALVFRKAPPSAAPAVAVDQPPAPGALDMPAGTDPTGYSRLVGRIEPLEPLDPDLLGSGLTPLAPLDPDAPPPGMESQYTPPEEPSADTTIPASTVGMRGEPPTTPPPADGEQPELRRHRIRDGDTLSSLAERYLGDRGRYFEIFELNRDLLPDPSVLPIGREIVLPPRSADAPLEEGTSAGLPPSPDEPGQVVPIEPGALRPLGSTRYDLRTYRVRKEDTLAEIARRFYGDPTQFQQLFEANRDRLRTPDDVREGLLLVIP